MAQGVEFPIILHQQHLSPAQLYFPHPGEGLCSEIKPEASHVLLQASPPRVQYLGSPEQLKHRATAHFTASAQPVTCGLPHAPTSGPTTLAAQHPLAILEVLDMADGSLHTVLRAGVGLWSGQTLFSMEVACCAIALVTPGAALSAG